MFAVVFVKSIPTFSPRELMFFRKSFFLGGPHDDCQLAYIAYSYETLVLFKSSAAILDTRTIRQTFENMWRSTGITREQFIERIKQRALLKRMPVVDDTAKTAAFLASDRANNDRNYNQCYMRTGC